MNTYFAIVHKDPDSSFGITFPDLPGCFSAAESDDDLLAQAQLALTLYVSGEDELPRSRAVSELMEDPSIKSDIADGAFFIAIPVITTRKKARYNLMLESDLVVGVDATARSIGMNRSEFVSEAIAARLSEQMSAVVRSKRDRVSDRAKLGITGVTVVTAAAAKVMKSKTVSKPKKSVAASALTQKVKKKR